MSTKYTGGFITKSPVAPTSTAASGIWTLDQQQQAQKAGTWPSPPIFIEDLFSTWLYTGNGAAQTITNGIDLAGKGGMVWIKKRSEADDHFLFDTNRGATFRLIPNRASPSSDSGDSLVAFNSNGFNLDGGYTCNGSGNTLVSWTFRKAPKFFDVVTYTGNGTSGRQVSHALGSAPGCMIIKRLDDTTNWAVYHRSIGATRYLIINSTAAAGGPFSGLWNDTDPSSTTFTLGNDGDVNANGSTYVAYLFAHDAGGFPASGAGSTNGISCGSVTTTSGLSTVDLGYEPQWLLMKQSNGADSWWLLDNMRGWSESGYQRLLANSSNAESTVASAPIKITSTGFTVNGAVFGSGRTYIYIAIRRGPMKVPTDATKVFSPIKAYNDTGTKNTTNFAVDFQIAKNFADNGTNHNVSDRLRGVSSVSTEANPSGPVLFTDTTGAETSAYRTFGWDNTGFKTPGNFSNYDFIYWNFQRAPGFFDEVCYTGTGANRTVAHNLTVAPELVIIKQRNAATDWWVINYPLNGVLQLNNPYPINSPIPTNLSTGATATTFSLGTYSEVNGSGSTYVAYLFATCAGVSKVGSYTGTGTTQTINCGFTAGARFVMIKRADDTGLYTEGWYVWDSARGIVAGNDPYLLLNSTAAEVTNTDFVDTANVGFEISSTAPAAINASGGTFIFLAIA